jgi:hypothetical protein
VSVARLAQPHARAPADEAPEVVRLGERPLRPRGRHLEPVVHEQVAQVRGDPLAQRQIHPARVVDEQAQPLGPHLLARQQLDLR